MKKINRQQLLHELESVQPGLSSREIIEQSSCFVFKDGKVMTYNDEVACAKVCCLPMTGAVQAAPLLTILGKLVEEELEVEEEPEKVVFVGKGRKLWIRREAQVLLPVDKVEVATDWRQLPAEFLEAVDMVQHTASHDESKFQLTCVHLHPKYIEACDNFHITRVKCATGMERSVLVRSGSLKHIVNLGVKEISQTDKWIHFRNATGLVLSARRYPEDYPDFNAIFNFKGIPITIPRGLGEAADKAAVFSAENSNNNQVVVELKQGRLRVTGTGVMGGYQEVRKLAYDGPNLEFLIAPELLIDISTKYTDAEIVDDGPDENKRLKVRGPNWVYVACLSRTAPTAQPQEQEA